VTSEASRRGRQPALSERDWQEQVTELAHLYGWDWNHTRTSRGKGGKWVTATSCVGFPDITAWHPAGRVMFVELKTETGKVRPEQERVLASLTAAGAEVHVWRPSDLPAVQAALNTRGEK
jgi:hypothetical protein